MLQAAACHEVSMAHPLSVFDQREPEHKERGESEEEKKTDQMLNKLASNGDRYQRLEEVWWTPR